MTKSRIQRHVNLKIIIIKRLKNNLGLEIYLYNFSTFTEKLIIIYTIIHEISGIKQREYTIKKYPFEFIHLTYIIIIIKSHEYIRLTISRPDFWLAKNACT